MTQHLYELGLLAAFWLACGALIAVTVLATLDVYQQRKEIRSYGRKRWCPWVACGWVKIIALWLSNSAVAILVMVVIALLWKLEVLI